MEETKELPEPGQGHPATCYRCIGCDSLEYVLNIGQPPVESLIQKFGWRRIKTKMGLRWCCDKCIKTIPPAATAVESVSGKMVPTGWAVIKSGSMVEY